MKKLLLICLVALGVFTSSHAYKYTGPVAIIGPDDSYRNYIGRIYYQSIHGNYSYIKIATGSTLTRCQQDYYQKLSDLQQASAVWQVTFQEPCHRR